MTGTLRILTAAMALAVSAPAYSVEFNYTWKKGDVHRFAYEDDTTFKMTMSAMPGGMPGMPSGMGMDMGGMGMPGMSGSGGDGGGMTARMKVMSTFSQKVLSVRPDGTADVELTIEKLDLFQEGRKVATISKIPPKARVVKAEIDRKGNAKFFHMVTVYQVKDQFFVGVRGSAGKHSASASATGPDGTTVELVAAVNPKTGRVTASAKVTERPPPVLTKTRVKQEDPSVDVIPKQILEMMVLPDGEMEPGGQTEINMPLGNIAVKLDAMEGNVATLKVSMAGKKVSVTASPPEAEAADAEDDEGMGEMGSMPAMGGGAMEMGGGGQEMMGTKMDLEIESRFDVAAGKLLRLQGAMGQDIAMGGMASVKTQSKFKLERVR